MGIVDRLRGAAAVLFRNATTISYETFQRDYMGAVFETAAGIAVTPSLAMQSAAVFGCNRILCGDIASAPLFYFERDGEDGRHAARDHRMWALLHDEPNPDMDARTWKTLGQKHLNLRGNFYCFAPKFPGGKFGGQPKHLTPIHPDTVTVGVTTEGKRVYDVRVDGKAVKRYLPQDIFHVLGMPDDDGLRGMSPIMACRNAIGLGLAVEETQARMNRNNLKSTVALVAPNKLGRTPEEAKLVRDRIREDYMEFTSGANQGKPPVLEGGLTLESVSISPQDAEVLETRKFQLEEICGRIFGIPPWMLGYTEKSTSWGTGIEQQMLGYLSRTLLPITVAWESAIHKQLLSLADRARYFAEFNLDGLLRADIKTRYTAYNIGRMAGFLSANDIRPKENLPRLDPEIGDTFWTPANMVDAGEKVTTEEADAAARLASRLAVSGSNGNGVAL